MTTLITNTIYSATFATLGRFGLACGYSFYKNNFDWEGSIKEIQDGSEKLFQALTTLPTNQPLNRAHTNLANAALLGFSATVINGILKRIPGVKLGEGERVSLSVGLGVLGSYIATKELLNSDYDHFSASFPLLGFGALFVTTRVVLPFSAYILSCGMINQNRASAIKAHDPKKKEV